MNMLRSLLRATGCVLILVMLFRTVFVSAQDAPADEASPRLESRLRFAHLDSDDGLVQNHIEAILQDHNGFMWFGTDGGISRYDGYRFTNFQHEPDNPNSLSNDLVNDIYEDSSGIIWIATSGGGINRLDPVTETFTNYPNNIPNTVVGDRHLAITQDSRGHLWFGGVSAFGLTDFDPVAQTGITYLHDDSDPDAFHGGNVSGFAEADDGTLWISAQYEVSRFDFNTTTFTNYTLRDFQERDLRSIYIDSNGDIWAGGSKGLYKYNKASDTFDHYSSPRPIMDMLEDENGLFWLTTLEGLYRYDPQTQTVVGTDRHYDGVADSLSTDNLTKLYRSRSGIIWVGGDNGVDAYDPLTGRFDYYRHMIPGAPYSLTAGELRAIDVVDDTTAWLGVDSVLHKVDLSSGEITLYPLEDYGIDTSVITATHQDHAGIVWIGDGRGRLLQFDPIAGTFAVYPGLDSPPGRGGPPNQSGGLPQDGPPNQPVGLQPMVVSIQEDAENKLWVGVDHRGLYRIDETRASVVRYDEPEGPQPSDVDMRPGSKILLPITNLYVDRSDKLWVTTLNGVFRFDPIRETYEPFHLLRSDGTDTWVESSLEDEHGMMWVATRDGLFRLDPQTKAVTAYTTADGLPSNYLVGIQEAQDGDLWLSTKKGLSRFTPSTGAFRNFDAADGLQGNEFDDRVFAQAPDGRMFFGGSGGLTAFYPPTIIDSSYDPPVILDDFELFNQPVQPSKDSPLSRPIWQTNSITLDYSQNILSFEFAALNYSFGDKDKYRYRLEGFEDQWNQTDSSRRFATYTNLPAGQYTLRVQAANRDGIWSSHEVALALTILPPWWQTTGFRLVLVLSVAALVFGAYRWRIRAIAQRNRELQREVASQTRALKARTDELLTSEIQLRQAKEAAEAANRAKSAFLANMSHELRSPLNAVLGFAQVSSRSPNLPADVRENLGIILHGGEHLLALINQVLDFSKIEAGQMTLDAIDFDLHRMLDDLEDMFILSAEEKRLTLEFERSSDLPRYLNADATKLRQVLINLIGNALKFTVSGGITVRAMRADDGDAPEPPQIGLKFRVADTGPGIPAEDQSRLFDAFTQTSTGQRAQEGTGLGLAISRKIIRLMRGDITVNSQPGQGATFTFDIICEPAHAAEIPAERTAQAVVGLEPGQPTYRVLVVDDKWTNRQLIVKLLQPLGFEVREAEHGQEAVSIAQTFKPDLVWMDIRMPVMDGIEATRQLKETPEGKSMVIIAMTASIHDEERAEAISIGCDDLLRKPFQAADLFEMMGRHLGVRYVYGDEAQAASTDERTWLTPPEVSTSLRSVPPELIRSLVEGIELGDVQMIDGVTAEISQCDARLAETFSRLTQRFEFDELLELLKETTG